MFLRKFKYDFLSIKVLGLIILGISCVFSFVLPLTFSKGLISSFDDETIIFYQVCFSAFYINLILILLLVFLCLTTKSFLLEYFKKQGYITHTLPMSTTSNVLAKIYSIFAWLYITIISSVILFTISLKISNVLSDYDSSEAVKLLMRNVGIIGIIRHFLLPTLIVSLFLYVLTVSNIRKEISKLLFVPVLIVVVAIGLYIVIYGVLIDKLVTNIWISQSIKLLIDIALTSLLINRIIQLIDNRIELS